MAEAQLLKVLDRSATIFKRSDAIVKRSGTIIHPPTQEETTPTRTQNSIGFTRSATPPRGILDRPITLVPGGEDEIKKLETTLESIESVLPDAEKRQVKERAVRRWLERLRDILYDIDDVLDMWDTALLQIEIKGEEGRHIAQQRPDITSKIKKLNEKLGEINRQKDTYQLKTGHFKFKAEELQREKPTAFSRPSRVFGRDEDAEVILSKLSEPKTQSRSDDTQSIYDIISIVGMGGIGKTTLAQRVYNDPKLKAHFHKRIWVCVSDPFDDVQVAKSIAKSLGGNTTELTELQTLLEYINESISEKKFMLVLDDVWTEESSDLIPLLNSLQGGASGSKILVTARNVKVVRIIGSTFIRHMGKLPEQESWELFSQMAFFEKCEADRENLEDVGREIAKKCRGLPLALTVIGSHLSFKTTETQWRNVLNSEIWELEPAEEKLFPPLMLSYYDLPSAIKPCFSYCAVFPKDVEIETQKLIRLWMSQGYLSSRRSTDMETTGQEYFEHLVSRSFFQDFKWDEYDGGMLSCKMHDIVHDFAQFLAKNECISIDVQKEQHPNTSSASDKKYRHLRILNATDDVDISATLGIKNLHTLIVSMASNSFDVMGFPYWLQHSNFLKALDLSGIRVKSIPEEIGQFVHLRYLDLSDNYFLSSLPETICELCNLQTLLLNRCYFLKKLPEGIGKLINLRHLEIKHCDDIIALPKGIATIHSLQTLSAFCVGESTESEAAKIGDLKYLNNLQGILWMKGLGNVSDGSEAKTAELEKKEKLKDLRLDFRNCSSKKDRCDVIEALQPHHSLEILMIEGYDGKLLPTWITLLSKLRKLNLGWCHTCEQLPPLGKLPSLESLYIITTGKLKRIGKEFLVDYDYDRRTKESSSTTLSVVAFPKLKNLIFHWMLGWEEWDETEENEDNVNFRIFPCLQYLEIKGCLRLKSLPQYIKRLPIQKLILRECPILKERYNPDTGEDWNTISHIPSIQYEIDIGTLPEKWNTDEDEEEEEE